VLNSCEECLKKQRKIDELAEENQRLKAKLRYLKRKEKQGYFGASTPSSKLPVKANATAQNQGKRGGAKPGHRGHGRRAFDETQRVVTVQSRLDRCPQCGGPLQSKGSRSHSVMEMPSLEKQPTVYVLPRQYCARCRRMYQPSAPGVLPKSLYSNRLMATAAAMHYLHGTPIGRICEQTGLSVGPLIGIFHQLGRIFAEVPSRLIERYRQSPAKHADETSWRCDGRGGYVWLFATVTISIFVFRSTRSASVVREVLGTKPLPGTLVVDRYNGYNKAPCTLQYCYSHLCRDLKEIDKQFPQEVEVRGFVDTLMPLMATAMALRRLTISDAQFYKQARAVKSQMIEAVHRASQHLAVRGFQEMLHHNEHRLYHWVEDRRVAADNNLAERDLRPTVIARKVSFGSQSEAGSQTRGVLMTVLHTLRKRNPAAPVLALTTALDRIAQNPTVNPFDVLLPDDPSQTPP
jgi:hypothetical protein